MIFSTPFTVLETLIFGIIKTTNQTAVIDAELRGIVQR